MSKPAKTSTAKPSRKKSTAKTKEAPVEAAADDSLVVDADQHLPEKRSGKSLVIVESPAKAKTLRKYLGRGFDVRASVGHIKDLPKSTIGVDVEDQFRPTYEVIKGKQKVVDELKKAARAADKVYLAADPDREGEAIAWHVAEELRLPDDRVARVLFHEITKPAVLKAIANPLHLNKERYESQQARRILDRLVGYKISPLLWTKVRRGLSAGRVQSVAVRLIVEREKEIRAFVPTPYWTILAKCEGRDVGFRASLARVGEERIERTTINDEQRAKILETAAKSGTWTVTKVQQRERKRNPYAPFITSTLQQEAAKRFYFSAKKTMTLAQQLYEGIDIGESGTQGLITYMRTDSTRLSPEAVQEARTYLRNRFGAKYVPEQPNDYPNKKKNAQDAHEAIRPTSVENTPEKVKPFLDDDQWKLYDLVWRRYLACQMTPAIYDQTSIEMTVSGTEPTLLFRASGSILRFDGFLALWQSDDKDEDALALLPELAEGDVIRCLEVVAEKHMTQPPPRYSETSLIKELEEKGIGRPSTYASIVTTIQDRKYVEKRDNRFYPTELGEIVTELLVQSFGDIVDVPFTAMMEDQLDRIEEGTVNWVQMLNGFYGPFQETLKKAAAKMRNVKAEETPTDLTCEKCSKPLVIKWGRNGKFVACQGYPECRFTSEFVQENGTIKLVAQPITDEKCPNCTSPMAVKSGRFGRFLACTRYPECKTTKALTTGIVCPECKQGELSEKRTRFGKSFYSCTRYPDCKYALWDKPLKGTQCPACQHSFLVEHYTKKAGAQIQCPNKGCGYRDLTQSSTPPSEEPAP